MIVVAVAVAVAVSSYDSIMISILYRIGRPFLVILAVAALTGPITAHARAAADVIIWQPCGQVPGAECGTLRVPLDWSRPDGRTVTLAIARRPAEERDARIGTLFYNPGGPGGIATGAIREGALQYFPDEIRRRFDLIGVDPRGVGRSEAIQCARPVHDPDVSEFPGTPGAYDRLVRHNHAVGASCGVLAPYVDTASVARDFDAVRQALGESKISFLGQSYGSVLGTDYARLFPGHVRTMALDGVVDHGLSAQRMVTDAATAVEDGFDRFAAWCERDTACALHDRSVAQVWDHLVREAARHPLPVPDRLPITSEDLRYSMYILLMTRFPDRAADLSQTLAKAASGDTGALADVRDAALYNPVSTSAYRSIVCQDIAPEVDSYAGLRARERDVRQRAPHMLGTSEFWDMTAGCLGWPGRPANPQRPVRIRTAPPVLLIGNTHDPATPLAWAHSLSTRIAGSGVLTYAHDGHTAYRRNDCVTANVDTYLLTGALPPPGTVCT